MTSLFLAAIEFFIGTQLGRVLLVAALAGLAGHHFASRECADREAQARTAHDRAVIERKSEEAAAAGRLSETDRARETLIGRAAGDMQFTIGHFLEERSHASSQSPIALPPAANLPRLRCIVDDAFSDGVRRLDAGTDERR